MDFWDDWWVDFLGDEGFLGDADGDVTSTSLNFGLGLGSSWGVSTVSLEMNMGADAANLKELGLSKERAFFSCNFLGR